MLASASPRRRELLEQIGISFEVIPTTKDEIITQSIPEKIVESLSYDKAHEIAKSYTNDNQDTIVIIGADTVVAFQGEVMGKPQDEADAVRILLKLQGNTHQVYTGVTLIVLQNNSEHTVTFHERTDVYMYPVTTDQIKAYVATKEPMDKAGAYGIQGKFAVYIKKIDGEYNNVVGLPVARMMQELIRLGLA